MKQSASPITRVHFKANLSYMFRQRQIQDNLYRRAVIIDAVRAYFRAHGYLEVDTPVRNPALAVEAHIEPFNCEGWFLQTSPEICMKRLLAAGYQRIFQICKCFRKHERGHRHLPEMNLLEWYAAHVPFTGLMTECEELFRHVALALGQDETLTYGGRTIALDGLWERLSLSRAFELYAPVSLAEAMARDRFEEVMSECVEPQLGFARPVFVYAYPQAMGALARPAADNPAVVERFELYVAGIEVANAFGELTDVVEQRRRFEAEQEMQRQYGHVVMPLPERFLAELGRMPPTSGIALGLDRLVMLFCNVASIDEVTAFIPENLS